MMGRIKRFLFARIFSEKMKKLAFIISGIIPSKKNSKKLFKNKATGRNFIVSSDSYREWENKHIYELGEWMQKNGNFL
jgi:hypothetical protein